MRSPQFKHESEFPPWPPAIARDPHEHMERNALAVELRASSAREAASQAAHHALLKHQESQWTEFDHRLLNGLQLICGLLSSQSRTAPPEAAVQLTIAARRIAAFGRAHRWLHFLDHQERVELKQYLQHLCEDLSALLFPDRAAHAIAVEGDEFEMATGLGIPLGFIVNELITNAAKHTEGTIIVRLRTISPTGLSLSVLDDGPGLPVGFDPAGNKGLGMKIVLSLVEQIGGKLHVAIGDDGRGTCFTVTFHSAGVGVTKETSAGGAL